MPPHSIRSLSIVVPVYNSRESLGELAQRLQGTLDELGITYEIILVDDGSRDGSGERIRELSMQYPRMTGVQLMRNYGQHNALLCGIRRARNELVVTLDDDLQHPPEEIPKLLARLTPDVDVVYGTPQRQRHGLMRDLASTVTKLALQGAMGARTAREASAFRAFRTRLRDAFADYHGSFVVIDVLLTWGTVRFASVPVRHDARSIGRSQYTFRKLVGHALNMMTGFSVLPLQVATFIGFGFTLFGLGVLIYVVGRYLIQGGSVPGFSFLASTIAIFSGAQLFALGIIGEYLARIHFRMMGRPTYTVEPGTSEREGA